LASPGAAWSGRGRLSRHRRGRSGAAGNFVDTANKYTEGTSERILGELIAPERDRIVLATKYTLSTTGDDPNASGNHRKNIVQAVKNIT
jgi:aryl-alcohol dehydrogenase-like predicted oxidoreductase